MANTDQEYPQVKPTEAAQGVEIARNDLIAVFQPFVDRFGAPPDERGLTDRFLFLMSERVGAMRLERFSVSEEKKNGCDYCLKFWSINTQIGPEKRAVFLQAKSYKVDNQTSWLVADFTATTKKGAKQMDLIANTVQAAKTKGVTIIGGYLLYGPDSISFIPLSEILELYKKYSAMRGPGDPGIPLYCNRKMSEVFYRDRQLYYAAQDLFTSTG